MKYITIDSPVGPLTLTADGEALTGLYFGAKVLGDKGEGSILDAAKIQLGEYFSGKRRSFDLPLKPQGTAFRMQVWQALLEIPYGETRTYGEIAAVIGSPKATRAVGNANHHNPISIIIPCHRVVGFNGALTGYGGGIEKKQFLLTLEDITFPCKKK